jgi:hypothetical protein
MNGYIERLADGPYLEMFARTSRPGCDARGTQGLFDNGAVGTPRWGSGKLEVKPAAE